MTKGALIKLMRKGGDIKMKMCSELLDRFATIATNEVMMYGKSTIPGLCRIKTCVKPAVKAGVRMVFGKEVEVAARRAKIIVKAYPVVALKK